MRRMVEANRKFDEWEQKKKKKKKSRKKRCVAAWQGARYSADSSSWPPP